MTYADFFYDIKSRFMEADVSDIHEHLAFQFNVVNPECGGIFYVEVKDGKLDPVAAFTIQKLKVEGSIEKALRLKEIIDLKKKKVRR